MGICGGAGLATRDGIGLLDISRKPTKERVPSFNGRIGLNTTEHSMWKGLRRTTNAQKVFHAWWPSQLLVKDAGIRILARYGDALPDSFSSDVNVGDANAGGNWAELENRYGINLDPARLKNEPAVVEGSFGKGRVLLSLIHFDTADDRNGALVLRNLWQHFGVGKIEHNEKRSVEKQTGRASGLIVEIGKAASGLVDLGTRNFLWFTRGPVLFQWRRGVRGMEYCTLYRMVNELCERQKRSVSKWDSRDKEKLLEISELLLPFVEKAKRLLLLERYAMQDFQITYDRCDVPEIQKLRMELFSDSKSYGGLFKRLIDRIDSHLYGLIVEQENEN